MAKTFTILVIAVAAVNLSNGFSIKAPITGGISGSFSGSSSSSSAFSQASSSSFAFNGELNPLEKLKAGASALVHGGANGLASAGAVAHAGANALAHGASKVIPHAGSGSFSGSSAGAGAFAGSGAVTGSGAVASSGALASSGYFSGPDTHTGSGANAESATSDNSENGSVSDCSGTSNSCGGHKNSNIFGSSTVPTNAGSYKIINGDKYSTGYTSGSKTSIHDNNGQYTQGSKILSGGCLSCKGPFPGPKGSIHDYKPASSVPSKVNSGVHTQTSTGSGHVNIHQSHVPATDLQAPGFSTTNSYHGTGSGEIHVSPSLINSFPGAPGSIHSSKPASAVVGANAGAVASSASGTNNVDYTNTGPHYSGGSSGGKLPQLPGGTEGIHHTKPLIHGAGASSHVGSFTSGNSVLPGAPGSIHDSRPVTSLPTKEGSGYYSSGGSHIGVSSQLPESSGSTYYNRPPLIHEGSQTSGSTFSGSGSVSNIPIIHQVVGPVCKYSPGNKNTNCGSSGSSSSGQSAIAVIPVLPGPSGSIYDSKPVTSIPAKGAISESLAGESASATAGAHGAVTNIPTSHAVGPDCSSRPGSSNCQGSKTDQGATGVVSILPGPIKEAGIDSDSGLGYVSGAGSSSGFGSVSNIPSTHPNVGPSCSYSPGSPHKCAGSSAESNTNSAVGSTVANVPAPSIHPEVPPSSGTYYVNKPTLPTKEGQGSYPSFSQQIPCSGTYCGSQYSTQGAASSSFAGAQSVAAGESQNTNLVYIDQDKSHLYNSVNHDEAHNSGGIVFDGENGQYHNIPKKSESSYKNSAKGGYAVSSDQSKNIGVVIGPGTGHLPIEGEPKPFGTQGAFGGSAAFAKASSQNSGSTGSFVKSNQDDAKPFGFQGTFGVSNDFVKGIDSNNKPFGTQGAFGGSAAISKGSSSSQTSDSNSGSNDGFATGDVIIQKVDGTLVSPVDDGSYKGECSTGACNTGLVSGSISGVDYSNGETVLNKPSKCSGASCDATQVYIIEETPSKTGSSGSFSGTGCSSGICGESGTGGSYGSSNGFATGQVLVQKGSEGNYDITNQGLHSNSGANSYSGTNTGYSAGHKHGSSGCSSGLCGGSGLGASGSFGFASSGGLLNKLFGAGGLSGDVNKFAGFGFGGAGGYSGSGSNAGSYAHAGAGASAHASSYAHSY